MNCQTLPSRFSDYLEGSIPSMDKLHFDSHLRECRECSEEYLVFSQSQRLLHSLPKAEASPFFTTQVMARLDEPESIRSASNFWSWRTVPAMTLVASLAIVSFFIFTQEDTLVAPVNAPAVVSEDATAAIRTLIRDAEEAPMVESMSVPASPEARPVSTAPTRRPASISRTAPKLALMNSAPSRSIAAKKTETAKPQIMMPPANSRSANPARQWQEIQKLVAEINTLARQNQPAPVFLGGDTQHELVYTPVGFVLENSGESSPSTP